MLSLYLCLFLHDQLKTGSVKYAFYRMLTKTSQNLKNTYVEFYYSTIQRRINQAAISGIYILYVFHRCLCLNNCFYANDTVIVYTNCFASTSYLVKKISDFINHCGIHRDHWLIVLFPP